MDSAGSLRIPAAFCGVIGMKATPGRIPRTGKNLAQLTCSGVIAAEIDDLVAALETASGSHPRDPLALPSWRYSSSTTVPRVVFSADLGYATTDAAVAGLVRQRLERLHHRGVLHLIDLPFRVADPASTWMTLYDLDRTGRADPGPLTQAMGYRQESDRALASLFTRVDVLVTPTTPQTAFPCHDYESNLPAGDLCWLFNISGHPAATVPVGLLDGLPVGAQIVAAPHQDSLAIDVARRIRNPLAVPPMHASRL